MEHRSHRIRINNIPQGKPIFILKNNTILDIVAAALGGIGWLFTDHKIWALAHVIYIIFALLRKKKNYILGYENFFVISDIDNDEYGDIIYNSEVRYWEFRVKSNKDEVMFYMNDGEKYLLENYVDRRMHNYLMKIMPEKEIKSKKERIERGV